MNIYMAQINLENKITENVRILERAISEEAEALAELRTLVGLRRRSNPYLFPELCRSIDEKIIEQRTIHQNCQILRENTESKLEELRRELALDNNLSRNSSRSRSRSRSLSRSSSRSRSLSRNSSRSRSLSRSSSRSRSLSRNSSRSRSVSRNSSRSRSLSRPRSSRNSSTRKRR